MKKLTILLLVVAFVAFAITPALAAKGTSQKEQPRRIAKAASAQIAPIEVQANEAQSFVAPPVLKAVANKATALSGLYSIGTLAPGGYVANYVKLSDAVNDLQLNGVGGPVTFEFTDAAYSDTGVTIGGYAGQGAANPVTFQLAPANPLAHLFFTGGLQSGTRWCVRFNAAQYVTFQGTTLPWVKGVTNRPLEFEVDTLDVAREVFRFSNGNLNITMKDMKLAGWRRGTGTIGPVTAINGFHSAAPIGDRNTTLVNCEIYRCGFGANFGGPTLALSDTNIQILGNNFGRAGLNVDKVTTGLRMSDGYGNLVDNNVIAHGYALGLTPESFSVTGIDLVFGGLVGCYFTHNLIHDFERATGSGTAIGILFHGTSTSLNSNLNRIINNMIWDMRYDGIRSGQFQTIEGIYISPASNASTVGALRVYNNSINLTGSLNPASPGHAGCIAVNAPVNDGIRLLNNVLEIDVATPVGAGSYCIQDFSNPLLTDNTDYWPHHPTDSFTCFEGNLAAWQGVAGGDAVSVEADPGFYSPTNLHIDQTTVGFVSPANGLATPLPYITDDIDKEGRDPSTPDAGADEFVPTPWPHDAMAVGIIMPTTAGMPAGKSNIVPTVTVRNNGANTDDITVRVILKDNLNVEVYNHTVLVTIPSLTTQDVLTGFPAFPVLVPGDYTVTLRAEVYNDGNNANDAITISSPAIPKFVGSYSTDFEDGGIGWSHAPVGLGVDDWVLGTPNKPGFATQAHSGNNAWVTKLTGNYSNSSGGAVYSPYFDLSNVPFPIIKFWHKWSFEKNWDVGVLEYSLDLGATWTQLGTLNDPKGHNWYNRDSTTFVITPAWCDSNEEAVNVYTYSWIYAKAIGGADQVRLRFHMAADNNTDFSGWAIDDFQLNAAPSISGKVYNDADNSASFNAGDVPITGAKVFLAGALAETTLTNATGDYEFTNLFEGTYDVSTDVVFGTNVTPGGAGTYTGIALVKNVPFTADFGYYNAGTVTGTVWYDRNHNQQKDAEEPGMAVQIDAAGPANVSTTSNGVTGNYTLVLPVAGNYAITESNLPVGYLQNFPKVGGYNLAVTFGDVLTGNDFGNSDDRTFIQYRTIKYDDWALAADSKGKQKPEKKKNDKCVIKFNLIVPAQVPTDQLTIKFGMVTTGIVTAGKTKVDTLAVFGPDKAPTITFNPPLTPGDLIQIDAIGNKGKQAKVKFGWGAKASLAVTDYKRNDPQLPMPNYNNVGDELFLQNAFPNGLLIGIPQGAKNAFSVTHANWKTVMKSLSKFSASQLHTDTTKCLSGLLKQVKGNPPDKYDSRLFAELLALKLNVTASQFNKIPFGLGDLHYSNPASLFDGQTIYQIISKADSMVSCLVVTSKLDTPTVEELYTVMHYVNGAFSGPLDTISFAVKTVLTPVAELKTAANLYADSMGQHAMPSIDPGPVPPEIPVVYRLDQNYPNPFNPMTTIDFSLPQSGLVTLRIYNMLGQEVATLLNNVEFEDGQQSVDFDASNLASGVYFYRLTIQGLNDDGAVVGQTFSQVKKMLLVK